MIHSVVFLMIATDLNDTLIAQIKSFMSS